MNRRPNQLTTHRVVFGGIALVLILGAVFIAFASTRGVPGAPKYNLTVHVANAAELTGGADVVIAGTRVGVVQKVEPVAVEGGKPEAEAKLALNPGMDHLPADTVFSIHVSGVLGRKIVAIEPGTSSETLPDGADIPISSQSTPVVDIDQFLGTFDQGAREGTRATLETLGLGFAGRGAAINAALQHLPATLDQVTPAMRIFSDPNTQLARFTTSLERFSAELVPTSGVIPGLVTDLDSTFRAFDSEKSSLQDAISKSPDFLQSVTVTARRARPLTQETTELMRLLEPGTSTLPDTAPELAKALAANGNLKLVPTFTARATSSLQHLGDYSELAPVQPGYARIADTLDSLEPTVSYLAPAENTCQYLSLLIRNVSSLFKETHATGTTVRAGGVVTDYARDSERGPSSKITSAKAGKAKGPVHSNPYPNTASPGQPYECEAGHEPYVTGRAVIGNAPGLQPASTEDARKLP